MIDKYKVITLCGSTIFKNEFLDIQRELTLEGNIVFIPGVFDHHNNPIQSANEPDPIMKMLVDIHKKKIDMSDEIFVINIGGRIGNHTKDEIEYAISQGKKVYYLEDINGGVKDE